MRGGIFWRRIAKSSKSSLPRIGSASATARLRWPCGRRHLSSCHFPQRATSLTRSLAFTHRRARTSPASADLPSTSSPNGRKRRFSELDDALGMSGCAATTDLHPCRCRNKKCDRAVRSRSLETRAIASHILKDVCCSMVHGRSNRNFTNPVASDRSDVPSRAPVARAAAAPWFSW